MGYAWKDQQSLTRWLQRLLYLSLAIDVLQLTDEARQRHAFSGLIAQGIETASAAQATDHADLWSSSFVTVPLVCATLLIFVVAATWIYRAAGNLRALDVQGLKVSPGWAVGWYFVPIANLWKPYEAMKEIWQASTRPQQWQGAAVSPVLPLWWTLWLLDVVIPWITTGMGFHADATSKWLLGNAALMISSLNGIPQNLLFIWLVGQIWKMQSGHSISAASRMRDAGITAPGT